MNRIILAGLIFGFPLTLSLWDIEEKISTKFPELAPFVYLIPYASVGLLVLLLIMVSWELFSWSIEAYTRLRPSTLQNMSCRVARAVDIPVIVQIAQTTIGPQITLPETQALYNHNRKCLYSVVDGNTTTVVGYFCLLPLTIKGESQVADKDLFASPRDLSMFKKKMTKGSSIYIGSLAAGSSKAKAATLQLAKTTLVDLEINKAYTRPITRDGVRLVKRNGFVPVSEHDKIDKNVYVVKIREFAV